MKIDNLIVGIKCCDNGIDGLFGYEIFLKSVRTDYFYGEAMSLVNSRFVFEVKFVDWLAVDRFFRSVFTSWPYL